MKRHAIAGISAALMLLLLSFSCSDSENRHLALLNQAKVVIDLNLSDKQASSGVLDTIRRLFVQDAVAATAPAVFSSITVRVTGIDIGLIEKNFTPIEAISLSVPAGNLRWFEVTAYVAPGDPSAAASFRGTAVANLPAGETVNVPVVMSLNETRLVVPDYTGQKIVMMDTGTGQILASKNASDIFGNALTLSPHDIDFDSQGRIYFSNYILGSDGGVFRMDNINSTWNALSTGSCVQLVQNAQARSISIDKKRNVLYYTYYSTSNTYGISSLDLISGASGVIIPAQTYSLNTVCVDENSGYIYYTLVLNFGAGPVYYIIGRDPATSTDLPNSYPSTATIFDLNVNGGYLYASLSSTAQVARLPLDLIITTPPVLTGQPGTTNNFLGPERLLPISKRRLYVIDELGNDGDNSNERIISFTDINGSGWTTYPNDQNIFVFYNAC
jgi:hypothetical protein